MYSGTFELAEESKPIRDIAYDRLKHAIITGELPAGSRIVETTYAEQLHISRTPLREALRKLERDGLVEYALRHGVVVRAFTVADIESVVVSARCRGKGYGKALMTAMIGAAKALKVHHIQLTSNPARVAANRLYQALGFEKYETNCYKMPIPASK